MKLPVFGGVGADDVAPMIASSKAISAMRYEMTVGRCLNDEAIARDDFLDGAARALS